MARIRILAHQSEEFSNKCLSVRIPQVIPFGNELAELADGWASTLVDFFGKGAERVARYHERIGCDVRNFLGLTDVECEDDKPKKRVKQHLRDNEDYLVKIPGWRDIVVVGGEKYYDERDAQRAAIDYAEAMRRSPTPPNVQDAAQILTTIDDIQDEAATLATGLMIIEKVARRAIPGVGLVATAADALNYLNVGSAAFVPRLPLLGNGRKRRTIDAARATSKGYRGRLQNLRRTGKLRLGVGDLIQAAQATDSMFGYGIQIGALMGFLTDSLFGLARGAEFRFPGPWYDPFLLDGKPCHRSPPLEELHPQAARVLRMQALSLWSRAARITPWLGDLPETVLASTLLGVRQAVDVLYEWGQQGSWVDMVQRAVEIQPVVNGGSRSHGLRGLRVDDFLIQSGPIATGSINRAIANVPSRERQVFYDQLMTTTAWKIMGMLEPEGELVDYGPTDLFSDVIRAAEFNLAPEAVQDLE